MQKYSIKELQDRYELKTRQSVYDRLNAVKAEVLKEGNRSYVTEDVITILDQLQEHLKLGGSIKTFTPTIKAAVYTQIDSVNSNSDNLTVNSEIDSVNSNSDNLTVNSEIDSISSPLDSDVKYLQLDLSEFTLEKIVLKIIKQIQPSNPINHWEKLDQAVERGYILSTKEVTELLGTKPNGKEWTRGAFKFIRFGKIGNQAGWQVTRI
ncbi:predicted transcriptional regulators (plasmid) [Geminocystis sp. NIES-3708]|uniref:hypothetical protein n=1 Tax=Geminocystis sp. NIES-3708 TaxID=1615909 RepID=UPI0005FC56FF|nr:hypothetical protein [Geminocystis sp. NIES-3708]BAQ63193.1 predicted transcriptional regulators [Geminocystis sp. NIES-3708]